MAGLGAGGGLGCCLWTAIVEGLLCFGRPDNEGDWETEQYMKTGENKTRVKWADKLCEKIGPEEEPSAKEQEEEEMHVKWSDLVRCEEIELEEELTAPLNEEEEMHVQVEVHMSEQEEEKTVEKNEPVVIDCLGADFSAENKTKLQQYSVVRTIKSLDCRKDPFWTLTTLVQYAETLEELELENVSPEDLVTVQRLPRLRRLRLHGAARDPEWACDPLDPEDAFLRLVQAVQVTAQRLQCLHVRGLPRHVVMLLLRQHALTLEEVRVSLSDTYALDVEDVLPLLPTLRRLELALAPGGTEPHELWTASHLEWLRAEGRQLPAPASLRRMHLTGFLTVLELQLICKDCRDTVAFVEDRRPLLLHLHSVSVICASRGSFCCRSELRLFALYAALADCVVEFLCH